jgi:hypothetical protein
MSVASGPTTRSRGAIGLLFLILSNVTLAFALVWLQHSYPSSWDRLRVLSLGNLAASTLLVSRHLTGRPVIPALGGGLVWLLIWSGAYCLIYGMFAALPGLLPLVYVGCAQALAPIAAGYMANRSSRQKLRNLVLDLLTLTLIAAFVFLRAGGDGPPIVSRFLVLLLIVCFSASQYAARRLALLMPAQGTSPRLSLLNGATLFTISTLGRHSVAASVPLAMQSLLLGCTILLIQIAMLEGFRRIPSTLSGIFMATNVPLFLLVEDAWSGTTLSPSLLLLAAMIACTVGARTIMRAT